MDIEKYGANWKLILSDTELARIQVALGVFASMDVSHYKDQAEMRDHIAAERRFNSHPRVGAVGQR